MTKADSTYQNSKVQLPQGADRLSIDSDGYFDFFGTEVDGQSLLNQLGYAALVSSIGNSLGAGSGVLSVINLPNVGLVIFSLGDGASNASAWLCSGVKVGQRMVIITAGVGSTGSVMISTSGVTINGGRVSRIGIRNSADSIGMVQLLGIGDEQWAVISTVGVGVTLHDGA
jgi:hypothetical protein